MNGPSGSCATRWYGHAFAEGKERVKEWDLVAYIPDILLKGKRNEVGNKRFELLKA